MKVIVSMATIPSRMKRLKENLPSLLNQKYPFDMLILNILDNLTEEEYAFYEELKSMDSRIILNKVEQKWRSCNKLLPIIKLYPEDIIITVDDDIYYPNECISTLMQQYIQTPNCIIAHEINPISITRDDTYIEFYNAQNVKLLQKEWGKYMTGCCLFPPHVFDGTDVFNYDKMMEMTDGLHDEVWFWINSTLNGVMSVGLNYMLTFEGEIISEWQDDEFRLKNTNCVQDNISSYAERFNKAYGKELLNVIKNRKAEFIVTKDNIYAFLALLPQIKTFYGQYFTVYHKNLTKGWLNLLMYHLNKS